MKICDRCGSSIKNDDMQMIKFPYYYIDIRCNYDMLFKTEIDLCKDCKQKIIDFILNKGKLE